MVRPRRGSFWGSSPPPTWRWVSGSARGPVSTSGWGAHSPKRTDSTSSSRQWTTSRSVSCIEYCTRPTRLSAVSVKLRRSSEFYGDSRVSAWTRLLSSWNVSGIPPYIVSSDLSFLLIKSSLQLAVREAGTTSVRTCGVSTSPWDVTGWTTVEITRTRAQTKAANLKVCIKKYTKVSVLCAFCALRKSIQKF